MNVERRRRAGLWLALFPAAVFIALLVLLPSATQAQGIRTRWPWIEELGLVLSLRLDGLALVFGLLVTGIGALVLVYSAEYLRGHKHPGRFYAFLLLFMLAMLGVVLADNVFGLYLAWELTSLSSYVLIGFEHEEKAARDAVIAIAIAIALVAFLGTVTFARGIERSAGDE